MISEWWRTEEHREHEIEREGESTKIGTHFFQETFTVHRPPRRACKAVDRRSVLRPSSRSMNPSLENKSKRAFQSQKICCSFRCFAFGASSPFTSSWQSLSQDPDLSYSERAEERRSRIGALRDDRVGGLQKLSSSRERSELSFFLITLHAPLSTILKRTLDNALSPLLPTTYNAQPISRAHAPPQAVPPRSRAHHYP